MHRATNVDAVAEWWRQPDRYDWIVEYVTARGFGGVARMGVAVGGLVIGLWPLLMLFSEAGVVGAGARAVSVASGVVGLVVALWFAIGWPARRQSKALVVALNLGVFATSLVYVAESGPSTGAVAFFLTASYVACMHTPRLLLAIVVLAAVPIGLHVVAAAEGGDPVTAVANALLRIGAVTVVPLTIQILVLLLGEKAVFSDIDPLTGLANRRGLDRDVRQLVRPVVADARTHVSLTVLDIDDFKVINDTYGHVVGDRALVTIAEILRAVCPLGAAVARVGGEEFVIVALSGPRQAMAVAERLRTELAQTPWSLTASFGVASTVLPRSSDVDTGSLTAHLIRDADRVMYVAKRAGGDRVESAP